MKIDPTIFKAYDIRGIYPEQLNEEGAYLIARSYATFLFNNFPGQPTIAVGSDMRLSGPNLKEQVIRGLLDSGINVDDLGLVSTPTFYFAAAFYGYDGGLQVSASHNPKEWNGIKIVSKGGAAVSKENGIYEMRDYIFNDQLMPLADQKGVLKRRDNVLVDAVAEQTKNIDVSQIKPLKIVVDASNAMGALDMKALFSKLSCDVVEMNFNLDGTFPVHEADPMKEENITDLKAKVLEVGADLGIAIDGDGDRYFFVDEKGQSLPQPILRGLMAQIVLKDNPGAKIGYDIRPGKITKDMILEAGGVPLLTPVGHSLIKNYMVQEGAVFGGESSGHFCFKLDYGTFEAPIVLVAKLLLYLSEQDKTVSEIVAPYKKYFHSGEVNLKIANHQLGLDKIQEVKKIYADGQQNLLDGVSVEYPDFWFNLRLSNTEPLIRFALEGISEELVKAKTEELKRIIQK
jgi:phosphomannomutase